MEPKLQRGLPAKAASGFPVRAGAREEKYRAWLYTPAAMVQDVRAGRGRETVRVQQESGEGTALESRIGLQGPV